MLGLDVVPEQVLRLEEPRTLVGHDEVDGLTLNLVWVVLITDHRLLDDLRDPGGCLFGARAAEAPAPGD